MSAERIPKEERAAKTRKPSPEEKSERRADNPRAEMPGLTRLQQQIGNRAVQRLLAQRSGDGSFEIDEGTVSRINRERSGGQSLDSGVQKQMGASMDHDFSGVRVHTSPEADDLSRQIGAKAFTTGQDIFVREGAYDPHSSDGQELLAHELTHVVQQSGGDVGGGPMTVTAPGDAHEQEADAVANTVTGGGAESQAQRQAEEEEELIQAQLEEEEEEEPIQAQLDDAQGFLQRQEEIPEEEV